MNENQLTGTGAPPVSAARNFFGSRETTVGTPEQAGGTGRTGRTFEEQMASLEKKPAHEQAKIALQQTPSESGQRAESTDGEQQEEKVSHRDARANSEESKETSDGEAVAKPEPGDPVEDDAESVPILAEPSPKRIQNTDTHTQQTNVRPGTSAQGEKGAGGEGKLVPVTVLQDKSVAKGGVALTTERTEAGSAKHGNGAKGELPQPTPVKAPTNVQSKAASTTGKAEEMPVPSLRGQTVEGPEKSARLAGEKTDSVQRNTEAKPTLAAAARAEAAAAEAARPSQSNTPTGAAEATAQGARQEFPKGEKDFRLRTFENAQATEHKSVEQQASERGTVVANQDKRMAMHPLTKEYLAWGGAKGFSEQTAAKMGTATDNHSGGSGREKHNDRQEPARLMESVQNGTQGQARAVRAEGMAKTIEMSAAQAQVLPAVMQQLDRLRRAGKQWVRVSLPLADGRSIRMECRVNAKRLQVRFDSDSPELLEVIESGWDAVAHAARERGFQLGAPQFGSGYQEGSGRMSA